MDAPDARQATFWSLSARGRVVFGQGCVQAVGDAARLFGRCCLVCTDLPLVRAGVVDQVVGSLAAAGLDVHVFEDGVPEVHRTVVEACAAQAQTIEPDVIVGVGGGSNMDLAKATAVLLAHGGALSDYYGENLVPGPTVPVVAVPTTAGTGSEVTPVTVIEDDALPLKVGIASQHVVPTWAFVDPELTRSCPPSVTAHSGLDALTHAVEAFTAADFDALPDRPVVDRIFVGKNPVSDTMALQAAELIGRHLVVAYRQPDNVDAREGMLLGSLLAGMAFASAGTGLVHAMQYPLGSLTKTSHGLGNGLLLPSTVAFNLQARETEYGLLAEALGHERDAAALPGFLRDLNRQLDLPADLRGIGVQEQDLEELARSTLTVQRLVRNNPIPVTAEDVVAILRDSLDAGRSQ